MRVQNINLSNYSNQNTNKNLGFKANVHSVVDVHCQECPLGELALMKLSSLFVKSAIESEKIKPENVAGLTLSNGAHGYTDLLLLDRTTSLHSELSSIEDPEILKQRIELAPYDQETEELLFSVDKKDICPVPFLKDMFGD